MSGEGPKLFANKPKKSKLKASTPVTMTSSSSTGAAAPAPPPLPPPQPQKVSFIRRYRFLWPLLLAVNFTIGAYVLTRTTKKDTSTSEPEKSDVPTSSTPASTNTVAATITEQPVTLPITEPVQRAPIPEDQQRELFKWLLEEKRKVKPKDAEEKKRIDEEKAILKQFIRAKSIPSL